MVTTIPKPTEAFNDLSNDDNRFAVRVYNARLCVSHHELTEPQQKTYQMLVNTWVNAPERSDAQKVAGGMVIGFAQCLDATEVYTIK